MDKITQLMVITMEECGELTQVCSKLLRKRHTNNEISEEECVNLSKKNTRNYIKRQLTWIRGNNISSNIEKLY